jgi:tetratricopeptide (TPR) repeat protein
MRHLLIKAALVAMVFGLAPYGFGDAETQPGKISMDTMTVAELETAGDVARVHKDYALAIQYFEAAIRKDKSNAVLYNKLGLAELKSDDRSAAAANFRKAVKQNPKYAEALNNLGAVDYTQKRYGSAAKYFKKAIALEETRATFHINLGAAWFGQNKMERAIAEYARALELDPEALDVSSRAGVAAQISSPEERAKYSYMLAKIHAKRGNIESCLHCLKMAKEQGYRGMQNVYKDEEFSKLWQDARLAEVVPPPER